MRPPAGPASPPPVAYDVDYARVYDELYLHPWPRKHRHNEATLRRVLGTLPRRPRRWLDLACGQAWHFSRFPDDVEQLGVDRSPAQLELAARRAPHATFVQADISEVVFPQGRFDLVTNFWAAYAYLDDEAIIADLVRRAVGWIDTGGALYFELLLPDDLTTFNESEFARRTGFRVQPRSTDWRKWAYTDGGGVHDMTSPPVDLFLDALGSAFEHIETQHDGGFMVHLVATGRRATARSA